jgi:hypothetical protein
MRTVFLVALLLIASGSHAAPAPVFRPTKVPKTAYEGMLAGLRKTGKAMGPIPTSGGTWTLTAVKVEGKRLTNVMLTLKGSDGEIRYSSSATHARIDPTEGNTFTFLPYGNVFGLGGDLDALDQPHQRVLHLSAQP